MIDRYGVDPVISDLSEFHGLSLVDVLAGHTHSPRSLYALITWLPDTGAVAAAMRGEVRGWGLDRHIQASVFDAVQANTWVTAAVSSKRKPRKPKPFPRPKGSLKKNKVRTLRVADLVKGGE